MKPKNSWKEYLHNPSEHDFSIAVDNPQKLTYEIFKLACEKAMSYIFTSGWSVFPTGAEVYALAMDDYIGRDWCKEDNQFYRAPQSIPGTTITLRNYCGTLELLITDCARNHWLYNKIDGLDRDEIVEEYWREVNLFIPKLGQTVDHTFEDVREKQLEEIKSAFETNDVNKIYGTR